MPDYAGQTIFGRTSFDSFGQSISGIGDINGDGFNDYVIGAPDEFQRTDSGFTSGAAYVVFGTADGPATLDLEALDGTNGFRVVSSELGQDSFGFGSFVSGLGDVNGDGYDDVIIGAESSNYGSFGSTSRENTVYVLFGQGTGFDAELDVATAGAGSALQITDADGLLTNLSSAGDINGDGFDDILIGQSPVPNNGGFGYGPPVASAVEGGSSDKDTTALLQEGGSYNGYVILGGSNIDDTATFSVLDLDGNNGFGVAGPRGTVSGGIEGGIYGQFGGGLVNLGDVNGDGFSDLFIQNVEGTVTDAGDPYNPYDDILGFTTTQYILFGSDSGFPDALDPSGSSEVLQVEWRPAEFFGARFGPQPPVLEALNVSAPQGFSSPDQNYAIAGIGDINGDGFNDVAVSDSTLFAVGASDDPDRTEFFSGPVHILYGSASGPASFLDITGPSSPAEGFTLIDSNDTGLFGAVVNGAGDVDGDGVDDLLISEGFGDTVTLVLGRDTDGGEAAMEGIVDVAAPELQGDVYRFLDTSGNNVSLGSALSAAGDVDGDGFNDFLIGAEDFDAPGGGQTISNAGAAFLVRGGLANLEAADNADGTDDNIIDIANLDVNVDTGLVPIDVTITQSFGLGVIQNEGNVGTTDYVFTLNRTGDLNLELTIDFAVSGSGFNAADAADFDGGVLPSGQVTFASGSATATITVPVSGDLDIEANEDFRVDLSNPVVAGGGLVPDVTLIDQVAFGRILNDEFPPEIRVQRTFVASIEGDPDDPGVPNTLTFVIERLGNTTDATGEVEVFYELTPGTNSRALLNADSNDIIGSLPSGVQSVVIAAGASQAEVVVEISPDLEIEPREEFNFTIVDIDDRGAGVPYALTQTSARGVIINDDGRPIVVPDGGEADVYGDPHIVTLDGLGYDFQAVGEYVLVETVDGAANPFSVQVRFEPFEDSDLVSVTTRMAVQIGGSTVEIDALTGGTLSIDGVAVDPLDPANASALNLFGDDQPEILFDGQMYTLVLNETDNGQTELLMVKAVDGVLNICVFLSSDAGGNAGGVRGLMGNNNGDLSDDFALRDGSLIPADELTVNDDGVPSLSFDFLYGRGAFDGAGYAGSWAIDAGERLFSDTAPAFPDSFPAGVVTLDDLPEEVVAAAQQAAIAAGVDPADEAIFNAAVLDFALTGNTNFLVGATELAATPEAETDPDDAPVLPSSFAVSAELDAVLEGDAGDSTTVNFSVFRVGDDSTDVDVEVQISGVDAADLAPGTALTQTVSFPAGGSGIAIVSFDVAGDGLVEADEALTLEIVSVSDPNALVATSSASTLIQNDDTAPVAEDDTASGDEDTVITILAADLLANDSDADGDALEIVAVEAASDGSASINGDGNIELRPDLNFFGTIQLRYTVSDGTNTAFADVEVTVNPVNDGPVANDDTAIANEDIELVINAADVLDNDTDVDGDTPEIIDVLAASGSATLDSDGNIVFLPELNATGTVDVTYAVSDGALTDTGTVSITIIGRNDSPDAVDDEGFEVDAGEAVTIAALDLLANDDDVDEENPLDVLSIVDVADAIGGTVEIDGEGDIVFTADADFEGDASFVYTISDGELLDSATVSLTVVPAGDPVNVVEAGPGSETLQGTDEVDVFVFDQGDSNFFGIDSVVDFEAGDQIDLSAFDFDNIYTGGPGFTRDSISVLGSDGNVFLISGRGFTELFLRVDGTVEDVVAGLALTEEDSLI